MKTAFVCLLLGSTVLLAPVSSWTQETVTIPQSRLKELEQKEAELERLKAGSSTRGGTLPNTSASVAPTAPAAGSIPATPNVPLSSLPQLQPGQKVSSIDLVSQYLADPVGAGNRYRNTAVVVEGKIVRVGKQLLRRQYELVLEGPQAGQELVCTLRAPDEFEAVYTTNSGAELVATSRGVRTTLAKVGTNTALRGKCKGLKGAQVRFVAE